MQAARQQAVKVLNLVAVRVDNESAKVKGELADARKATDEAIRRLYDVLNALAFCILFLPVSRVECCFYHVKEARFRGGVSLLSSYRVLMRSWFPLPCLLVFKESKPEIL